MLALKFTKPRTNYDDMTHSQHIYFISQEELLLAHDYYVLQIIVSILIEGVL